MRWKLFANLAETAGQKEVEVAVSEGATLRDAFNALLDAKPGLHEEVLDSEGQLRDHVNVLHNGTNPFVDGDGFDTELADGDRLALFPPVSGG